MRRNVVKMLRAWDAYPIENPAFPGTPDVNCTHGWLELKWLPAWPMHGNTVVQIDHFTNQQRIWLRQRWKNDGSAWLLLQVKREWLLFAGDVAADHVGNVTRLELYQHAMFRSDSGMTQLQLKHWLAWNRNPTHPPL